MLRGLNLIFWPDVHWAAIHDNNSVYTYGEKYVNFMKRAMDASDEFDRFLLKRWDYCGD